MKSKHWAILIGALVLCVGVVAVWNHKPADEEIPSSVSSSQPAQAQEPAQTTTSMYKKYWHDNKDIAKDSAIKLQKAKENSTPVEGKTMFNNLFQVYADQQGNQFIISDNTRVYLVGGDKISAEAMKSLRLEGTGERVYTRNSQVALNSTINDLNEFTSLVGKPQLGFDERKPIAQMSSDEQDLILAAERGRINNLPSAEHTFNVHNGYVYLPDLLSAAQELGYVSDYDFTAVMDEETKKEVVVYSATVNTASSPFKVEFTTARDSFEILNAKTNQMDYELDQYKDEEGQHTLDVSLEDVEHFLGWDIEVYASNSGGDPIVNIVTDNRDIANEKNFIVYESTVSKKETTAKETTPNTPPKPEPKPTDNQQFEHEVQYNMNKWGMSREEAEKYVRDSNESMRKADEKAKKKRDEDNKKRKAEEDRRYKEAAADFKKRTGIDIEDWRKLSTAEMNKIIAANPDISYAWRVGD